MKIIIVLVLAVCCPSAHAQMFLSFKYDKAKEALEQGNYEKAIEGLTELLTSATDQRLRALCFSGRSSANAWLQRDKQAVTDLDSAIALDNSNMEWYFHRGRYKYRVEDFIGAERDLMMFLKAGKPTRTDALTANGLLWFMSSSQRRHKEAITYSTELIALEPTEAKHYFNRGYAKSISDDHEGALADYDAAIKLDPRYAEAYINRAMAKFNVLQLLSPDSTLTKEQMADGCMDLQKALDLGKAVAERLLSEHCR